MPTWRATPSAGPIPPVTTHASTIAWAIVSSRMRPQLILVPTAGAIGGRRRIPAKGPPTVGAATLGQGPVIPAEVSVAGRNRDSRLTRGQRLRRQLPL